MTEKQKSTQAYWTLFFWILLAAWVTGAALFMAGISGGFLTNYLSDLSFPAWFYIYLRGLWTTDRKIPGIPVFGGWFGISPERTLFSILLVGIITEFKTWYLPTGIISGTFDPFDLFCYAVGLLVCYYFDKKEIKSDNFGQWSQSD